MARRSKKQHITYDSKETATIAGLLSLLLGLFFVISILSSSDNQNNLFTQARNLFGHSTLFTAFFLISVGLRLLGSKFPFTKTRSLIAQAILIVLIPGFLTAFSSTPRELVRLTGSEVLGGEVGYFIVVTLLGDTIPTQPATKFLLLALLLIIIPIALSLSVSEIVKFVTQAFQWISGFINGRDLAFDDQEVELPEKASTFGDFNKLLKQNEEPRGLKNRHRDRDEDHEERIAPPPRILPNDSSVEIKEGEIGEEGLKQDALKFPNWQLPPLSLLIPFRKSTTKEPSIARNARVIEQTLASFGIEAKVEESYIGPSVIQYALNIPLGIKVEKISNLNANIALALGVDSKAVRIESIPETTYLGIEVPRSRRDMVRIKELMEAEDMFSTKSILPVPVGKNIDGSAVIADIRKMPHLLISGATGSGKSVLTNSFITSLLMKKSPDEVKFILVDPKQVELSDYNGIPHLLTPVITDMEQVVNALKWAVREMDLRYTNLRKEQVRDIVGYNEKKGFAAMPYIVIVIDEMADMMLTSNRVEAETAIVRLAQKARAVGIHLILATQRPSVNVITGIIKANIPGRIWMSVASGMDSRVILDRIGAESLFGNGDMLYKAPDKSKALRLQSAYVDQQEVIRIVDFIKSQAPEVEYINEITEKQVLPGEELDSFVLSNSSTSGSLLEQGIRIAVQYQKGSSSFLQRKLNIGFNKAAQLVEELEELGVVGPQNGSKPREVLVSDAEAFIASLKSQSSL